MAHAKPTSPSRPKRSVAAPLACALAFLLAAEASSAGVSIRVEVEPRSEPALPFLVTASTHHYDLHNGNSRTRGKALTAPGRWQTVATGFRSPLLLAKVSATSFHPAYLSASVESDSWIGTLVNARMPVLRPVSWLSALEAGPLPSTGHGPSRARLADHVRVIHDYYLEHLDRAGIPFEGAPFEELKALVERGLEGAAEDDAFAHDARRRLAVLERFLGHPREARIHAADYRRAFGPKPLVERYLDSSDRERIQRFLANDGPDRQLGWFNASTSIHYALELGSNVHMKERPGERCTSATLNADGGKAAGLDDARMQTRAYANFCRRAPGEPWTWNGRYDPPGWPR